MEVDKQYPANLERSGEIPGEKVQEQEQVGGEGDGEREGEGESRGRVGARSKSNFRPTKYRCTSKSLHQRILGPFREPFHDARYQPKYVCIEI